MEQKDTGIKESQPVDNTNDFDTDAIIDNDFDDSGKEKSYSEGEGAKTLEDPEVEGKNDFSNIDDDKKSQSRDDNAKYAELRRKKEDKKAKEREEAEKQRKAIEEAETKVAIDILDINPYTHRPIKDKADLDIYKIQREIYKRGGDPIESLGEEIAERTREAEKVATQKKLEDEAARKDTEEKLSGDIKDFQRKYPNVNLKDLAGDGEYQEYAKGKILRWSTSEIYEGYLYQKEKAVREKNDKANESRVNDIAKKRTKIPSANGYKVSDKNISDMTMEEYIEYESIRNPGFKARYGQK